MCNKFKNIKHEYDLCLTKIKATPEYNCWSKATNKQLYPICYF